MFANKGSVRIPFQQVYQHDGDYDRCACGRRKLKEERLCSECREAEL